MSNKVELKVNVINQLKLFRQSTFKDILCFLDEDVQNAQRAKATELKVVTDRYSNTLTIENNGGVLDNPQSLFSIAESGWDNNVKKSENPFGMGFFSNISVSNLVEVITGNKHIIFDVDKMIDSGDCNLEVLEADEYYDGFKLILNNFNYDEIPNYEIRERVKRLGKYIHELDIYYNGDIQEKKDLTECESEYAFSTVIEDRDAKGWIAIANNYSFSNGVAIYYKGRFVTDIDYPYLKGDIHINDRVLNLTSPDRKDIIKDKKYEEFRELLNIYIGEMAYDAYMEGHDSDIEEYHSAIGYYIDKKQLMKTASFSVFKGDDKIAYLKDIAKAKRKNKKISTFSDYTGMLNKDRSIQGESHLEEVVVVEQMKSTVEMARGIYHVDGSSSYEHGRTIKPEIKEDDVIDEDGEVIFNNDETMFWIGFNEIEEFEHKFNIIKHYGLKLIVARNKVEQSILNKINEEKKVFHISDLQEDVKFESTISNTELNIKERRVLMILDMISNMFGYSNNIFSIGDVMTTKIINVEKAELEDRIIDENIVIIKDSVSKKVYVDRSIINTSKIVDNLDDELTLKDVQFVLQNIQDIAEAVALLKGAGTTDVKNSIIEALGSV